MNPEPVTGPMRLAACALVLCFLAPALLATATPVVDEGPQAFTYEPMLLDTDTIPSDVSVAVHGDKVGISWGGVHPSEGLQGFHEAFMVRDGVFTHRFEKSTTGNSAVVFDGSGRFHAAFVDRYGGPPQPMKAEVITFDGSSWQIHQLASSDTEIFHTPLALAHEGVPYVVFTVEDVIQVYRLNMTTDEWERWATLPELGTAPMGALDSQGRLHLVYHPNTMPAFHQERYAVYNGTWTVTDAPFNAGGGRMFAVATGPNDLPYFAYTDYNMRTRLVRGTIEGNYQDEQVWSRGTWSTTPRIVVDPEGVVSILITPYTGQFDTPTGHNAYLLRQDPLGRWVAQPILPVAFQPQSDMTEDDEGRPVIAIPNYRVQTVLRSPASTATGSVVLARPVTADRHLGDDLVRQLP